MFAMDLFYPSLGRLSSNSVAAVKPARSGGDLVRGDRLKEGIPGLAAHVPGLHSLPEGGLVGGTEVAVSDRSSDRPLELSIELGSSLHQSHAVPDTNHGGLEGGSVAEELVGVDRLLHVLRLSYVMRSCKKNQQTKTLEDFTEFLLLEAFRSQEGGSLLARLAGHFLDVPSDQGRAGLVPKAIREAVAGIMEMGLLLHKLVLSC